MTPYYDDGAVTIYHGDCRDVLPSIGADSVVTDPPYGTGHYTTDVEVLTPALLAAWVERFVSVAVFGWPERLAGLCAASGLTPSEWVCWWPTNGALRGRNMAGLWRESEHIAVFGDASRSTTLTRPRNSAVAERMAEYRDLADEARLGDVWTEASPGLFTAPHLRLHPNEKPLRVLHRLIDIAPGVVVDPFMGSGTTLRAAKDLGRRALGIEVDERYCEVAARRMGQEVLALTGGG